jgi:membrane associated rhomboid family serine protease
MDPESGAPVARRNYYDLYKQLPLVNIALIAAYFVLFSTHPSWPSDPEASDRTLLVDTHAPKREIWRLYTYSLLHGDWAHLVNNCAFMALLGFVLNSAHGNGNFLLLHTLGVVSGAVGVFWESVIEGGRRILIVGASGGVYCIIGAHVGNVAINFGEMPDRWYRILFLSYYIVADVLLYFFYHNALVSYSAHLGGFLAGAMSSPLVLINVREMPWERKLKYALVACVSAATLASGLMYALY